MCFKIIDNRNRNRDYCTQNNRNRNRSENLIIAHHYCVEGSLRDKEKIGGAGEVLGVLDKRRWEDEGGMGEERRLE